MRRSLFASFTRAGTPASRQRSSSAPAGRSRRGAQDGKHDRKDVAMPDGRKPVGDKSSYTGKQKRMAEHSEEG
jgi:hypothetical protein